MQPDSSQNPNPNPQSDQRHRHCEHHVPFPHVHIPAVFCPHHNHYHLRLHLRPHLHATQHPCNFPLPPSHQTSQGQEINHATVSDLGFPPQELVASNILEDNEEEEEDVFVLTDEWAEFFAKSEAKRQLEKQNKKKGKI